MQSSRLAGLALLAIAASFAVPPPPVAGRVETPEPALTPLTLLLPDCEEQAITADDAYQEWQAAEHAKDLTCSIYGIFSGECVVAVIITTYKEHVWNRALRVFFECHVAT